ncbi:putative prolyl 4-hydroxylase, alpha subunit [Helianthus debilis subsp. tardiflorus]
MVFKSLVMRSKLAVTGPFSFVSHRAQISFNIFGDGPDPIFNINSGRPCTPLYINPSLPKYIKETSPKRQTVVPNFPEAFRCRPQIPGNVWGTSPWRFRPKPSPGRVRNAPSRPRAIGFVHQGSLGPAKGEAYRDNDRIAVNVPVLADTLWESGLSKLFSDITIRGKVAVGLNPNIRLYRYKVGQRFGRHIDERVDLGEGKRTHYTLLIYLNGDADSKPKSNVNGSHDSFEPLVGGETVFYCPRNSLVAEVTPTQGMALFHIHGAKCMLHESRNVMKGVKYILRSDVAFA